MASALLLTTTLLFTVATAQDLSICPLNAPYYPAPTGLGAAAPFQSAFQSLAAQLDANATAFPYNETSFSIGVFSGSDPELLTWDYHHASPLLANSSQGATSVDKDSIYRIASMSKLTTVYLFLICAGEERWSDTIADWIPELLNSASAQSDAVVPDWESITIGDLAGYVAGLPRDYGLFDFSLRNNVLAPPPVRALFPPAPDTGVPVCGYVTPNLTFVACTAEEYIAGVAAETPIFPAAYTPVYNNAGFVILGVALERITGTPFAELFDTHLVRALGLNGTSYSVPPPIDERALVPGSPRASFWDADLGAFAPAGGSFSSTADFAALGKAILTSRLLSPATTRRWLKPIAFANGLTQGAGRPWEIVRVGLPDGEVVDVNTKAGDLGAYDTVIALIPTYDLGFTLFGAADPTGRAGAAVRNSLPNLLANTLITAAHDTARAQTIAAFAGTYSNHTSNSSLTLAAPGADLPGLRVTGWTLNGSDLYTNFFSQQAPGLDVRLLPNQLYPSSSDRVGFSTKYAAPMPSDKLFYGPCYGWVDVDQFMFAGTPVGGWVFEVDSHGRAGAVESAAFDGVRMGREG